MLTLNGFPEKINQYIKSNKIIDYYIGGISFEERCNKCINILGYNGVKISKKIILNYEQIIQNKDSKNYSIPDFDDLLNIKKEDIKINCDLFEVSSGIDEIKKILDTPNFEEKNIVIDVTCITTPYIFIMLKYLIRIKKNNLVTLMYTEPRHYLSKSYFTLGTERVEEIGGYSGDKELSKKEALIILLGFEGYRSVQIVEQVNPDLIIPINGFPAYRPEFKDRSILANEELLKSSSIYNNLRFAPANDCFETKKVLDIIYKEYGGKYNFTIAPLGTKPMSIGSCLFALEKPDSRVVYPYPEKYNPCSSGGYSNIWAYSIVIENGK